MFKGYIKQLSPTPPKSDLVGDPIVLPNGATLYFLGTNTRTAQSYHGNLYMDEYFLDSCSRSFARWPRAWRCTSTGD